MQEEIFQKASVGKITNYIIRVSSIVLYRGEVAI